MQSYFPPNLNPTTYNLIAVSIAILLASELNTNEQNSLGNWFMLLGQYLDTNAAQQQLIEGRMENGKNSNSTCNVQNEIDFLMNAFKKIQQELENIRRNQN